VSFGAASRQMSNRPRARSASYRRSAAEAGGLTHRERQIVDLLLEGCSNKEIASRLSVSERTIKNQLSALYRKTKVRSRLELALWAVRSGLE
jgi:DNA-binding NarL/FixJ family response regulator